MTLDHRKARDNANAGYKAKFGVTPNVSTRQCLQAIGALETGYGTWWKDAGAGSFNMGAITAGNSWQGKTFTYKDSRPGPGGKDIWYETAFRKYDIESDGWKDLANMVFIVNGRDKALQAANIGDTLGFSSVLRNTTYYTGRAVEGTAEEQKRVSIQKHHSAVMKYITEMCRELGEPMPNGSSLPIVSAPTLKRGATGDVVREMQMLLSLAGFQTASDGQFGPGTEAALKAFQKASKLKDDGICGPSTWDCLDDFSRDTEKPPAPVPTVGNPWNLAVSIREQAIELARMIEPKGA